jgi:hypothetical protein
MQKLCAKWVPPLLTMDQNQQRVNDSEQCLAIFNRNKDEFFSRYIRMNDVTHPIDSQPSELNAMNRIQSVERRNGQQAGIRILGCAWYYIPSITSKRSRPSTASIT